MRQANASISIVAVPVEQKVSPVCPDDLGQLKRIDHSFHCDQCGRNFRVLSGILELLPREVLQKSSSEYKQLAIYNASFSDRAERKWHRPLRSLLHRMGNAYLYSWAATCLESIAKDQSLLILDAGCGDGILRRYVSTRHAYVGIDFSRRPLLRARHEPGSQYFLADLNHLPFPSKTFDVVLSFQALQYLESPAPVLFQFARVLKPQGKLILTVPNADSFKYRLQGIPRLHVQKFDRKTIDDLLTRANFNILQADTRGCWIPFPSLSMHLPGVYPPRWGLSWSIVAKRKEDKGLSHR